MIFTATTTTTFIGNRTTINDYTHIIDSPIIVEYQEGMENWDIPYFEGMQSVKMPVLTTYTHENIFKNYIQDDSEWGRDYNCTTTDIKYSQNGSYVKITGGNTLCYSGFVSPSLPRGTYKFSCKVKVGQVGDSYRILVHDNPNNIANNSNGFASGKITSTKEIETFEYVGYFNGANSMLLYTYYKGQEIEYYDIMFTKLSDEDVTNVVQNYTYKSNILTVNEDVTLRSNGNVYDELNLLTGRLTQRIDENNEVLSQEVVKTVDLKCVNQDDEPIDKCCTFADGNINISSDELIPTLEYALPTTNYFELNQLQTNVNYTLRFDGDATSGTLGGSTINTVNDILVATSATDNILYLDGEVSNVMLLEGNYTGRDISYFTGMRSVEAIEVETTPSPDQPLFGKGGRK